MNQVTLIGRIGTDINLRYTTNGKAVTNIRLATHERNNQTRWHRVTIWGKQAENAQKYLQRGSLIAVQGNLRTDVVEGDNGDRKEYTKVHTNRVKFLDFRGRQSNTDTDDEQQEVPTEDSEPSEDDDYTF